MNSTIAVKKSIKNRAAARAKQKHLSLSAVANILLEEFSRGKIQIGAREVDENGFSPEFVKEVLAAKNDPEISAEFENVEDFLADLDSGNPVFSPRKK